MMEDEEGWATVSTSKNSKPRPTNNATDGAVLSTFPVSKDASHRGRTAPCRFFAEGFCAVGADCPLLHADRATEAPLCKFFPSGSCKYGKDCSLAHDRARLEQQPSGKVPANLRADGQSMILPTGLMDALDLGESVEQQLATQIPAEPFGSISFAQSASIGLTRTNNYVTSSSSLFTSLSPLSTSTTLLSTSVPQPTPLASLYTLPKSDDLCHFAMVGKCRYGELCRNIHGLQCPRCLRYCLHPHDVVKNEEHIEECLGKEQVLTTTDINNIECGICLEKIATKEDPRFGLMNCDHAFCLNCIRTWRSKHSMSDLATKSCPLCRMVSFFVIPSSTWTTEVCEKQKIIDAYKKKVGEIGCKYFNYGSGECPFGGSCFYAHRTRDGLWDERRPPIRSCVGKDEKIRVLKETRLCDFIDFKLDRRAQQQTKTTK